jgi:hypothetical protein
MTEKSDTSITSKVIKLSQFFLAQAVASRKYCDAALSGIPLSFSITAITTTSIRML